jgi:mannose-6-phosphate isomerase-like protein (cupin superfamily)
LNNITIIKTGINVSKILAQLKQYSADWGAQKNMDGVGSLLDQGFPDVAAGVLQLVMGGVTDPTQYVGDTEFCHKTPAYDRHTEIVGFMKRNFREHKRCGFLSLPVGGMVGKHIDIGSYYQTKDRYHLAIAGTYKYMVGDESVIVEPGTLMWFDNKLEHGTENIGDCVRVTFVFDTPHSKWNPK